MSLRDDLDIIAADLRRYPKTYRTTDAALDRLRAALTPAVEKWLEALPELMELEADATPGPYNAVRGYHKHGDAYFIKSADQFVGKVYGHNCVPGRSNIALIVKLRNALHEAARLHADSSALNAQDKKEE